MLGNISAMFTGKPHVAELGYAFLFRNYDSSLGKWSTADPLGYPDGWNNFAYLNNVPILHIDAVGLCRTVIKNVSIGHGVTKPVTVVVHDDIEKIETIASTVRGEYYTSRTATCGGGKVSFNTPVMTFSFSIYGFSWSVTTQTNTYELGYPCSLSDETISHSERGSKTVDYYWASDYIEQKIYYKCGKIETIYSGSNSAYLIPVVRESSLTQCKE